MSKQSFHHLVNFDHSETGYVFRNLNTGRIANSFVNVTLAIGDSIIASEAIPAPKGTGTVYNVDVADALRGLNVATGRYTLHVQPFARPEFVAQGLDVIASGPANLGASGTPTLPLDFTVNRISKSRTEIVISNTRPLTRSLDGTLLEQFGVAGNHDLRPRTNLYDYAVLAGGRLHSVINAAKYLLSDTKRAVLKLDRPLDDSVVTGDIISIVLPFGSSYSCNVDITTSVPELPGTPIRPADFTVRTNQFQVQSTKFLNSNQLTQPSDVSLSSGSLQNILDKALSGSGATHAELGIDYRKYGNFVHFGSAVERLENFKYKLQKIEHYSESIRVLSSSNASESFYNKKNMALYESRSNSVISSFDGYEQYLYYNSSSNETSSLGLYSASTWPKNESTYPYTNQKISDTEAVHWFYSQSLRALDYDNQNEYNLEKIVPVHVRVDDQNANFLTFVHMIGQHFDTLWTYVSHINNLYDRDERFNIGISKDILYEALGSLGWTAQSGYAIDDLWSYYNGTPFSGSTYDTLATPGQHPTEDITKEIWNRTLNNLPYLLKTRGTERGVKALLATYGMPSTLLQISEYGGKSKEQTADTFYQKQVFNRSLQFNTGSRVEIPWSDLKTAIAGGSSRGPDTHEVRIKPTLFSVDSASVVIAAAEDRWNVNIEPHPSAANAASSMSNHALLHYYHRTGSHDSTVSCSTDYLPLYDGDWWNVQITRTDNSTRTGANTFRLSCQKAGDFGNGKITHSGSAEVSILSQQSYWNGNYNNARLTLGPSQSAGDTQTRYRFGEYSNTDKPSGFSGSMQEYRAWYHSDTSSGLSLESQAFDNHTLNPVSIEGNSYTASFTDLILRYPLGTDNVVYDISEGYQISSSHPNFSEINPWSTDDSNVPNGVVAQFNGFENSEALDWNHEEETHFIVMPDIVGNRAISDKIRIDSSAQYSGQLSRTSSSLSSSIDLAGPDSPIVAVQFSPSHHIDLDIASQLGGSQTFDDFIGNPRDTYRSSYNELRKVRNAYWQKYDDRPTFQAYMNVLKYFDKSLFKQVDMMLPGRSIKQVGLEVRPTLLERNTVAQKSMSFANESFEQLQSVTAFATVNMKSSSIALSEDASTGSATFGTLNPTVVMLQPFEDNYAYDGMPIHASSYVVSTSGFYQAGEVASDVYPVVSKMRTSILNKRVNITRDSEGRPISRSFVETEGQDFRASALQNLYYGGCKIGSIAGSVGGVISYTTSDTELTYPGIIPGVLSAIEVVETNPNTVTVQSNTATIALPELNVR